MWAMVSSVVFVLMMLEREGCLRGWNWTGGEERLFCTDFVANVGGHGSGLVAIDSSFELVWMILDREGCLSGWNWEGT